MNKIKLSLTALALFFVLSFPVFGQTETEGINVKNESIEKVLDTTFADSIITIKFGGITVDLPTRGGKLDADEFGAALNEAKEILNNDGFPPKDLSGWVGLFLLMLPVFAKIGTTAVRVMRNTKLSFGNPRSSTIAKIMGLLVSALYYFFIANWDFREVDFLIVVATAYIVTIASNYIHDLWIKYSPLLKNFLSKNDEPS